MKKILRQALLPVALASAAMAAQAGDGYNYLYVDQVTQEHTSGAGPHPRWMCCPGTASTKANAPP